MAKFENNPNDKNMERLAAQITAVRTATEALLDDPAADPDIKAKAQSALAALPDPKIQALEDQVEELKRGSKPATPAPDADDEDPGVRLTAALEAEIRDYGLDPDDARFDWEGETLALYRAGNVRGVIAHIRAKIREGVAERDTTARRQVRKSAGQERRGGAPADSSTKNPWEVSDKPAESLQALLDHINS